jgi:hypothetical protein
MGSRNIPHYIFIKKKVMKIKKKLIKETVGDISRNHTTYSQKKQNIIITESQLEKILEFINKK